MGDLIEDRLLVYLWLKPVPRWQLPAAAVLATGHVVVPPTAWPRGCLGPGRRRGRGRGAGPARGRARSARLRRALRCAGLWFRRAIWWGLAFVLIWEQVAAYSAEGSAKFTVLGWASSVLGLSPDVEVQLEAGSAPVAVLVLIGIAVGGWLLATWAVSPRGRRLTNGRGSCRSPGRWRRASARTARLRARIVPLELRSAISRRERPAPASARGTPRTPAPRPTRARGRARPRGGTGRRTRCAP